MQADCWCYVAVVPVRHIDTERSDAPKSEKKQDIRQNAKKFRGDLGMAWESLGILWKDLGSRMVLL